MAIEKLKTAARAAQPTVINMEVPAALGRNRAIVPSAATPVVPVRSTSPAMALSPSPARVRERVEQPYPNVKVVVLDDDVNTFQHVVEVLVRHLPAMTPDHAWELAHRIDGQGSAVVWTGPLEQGELYHQLLGGEGLTMAPLERA